LFSTNEQDQLSIANNTIVQLNSQVLLSKQEIEKLKGELVTLTKQKAEMKTELETAQARIDTLTKDKEATVTEACKMRDQLILAQTALTKCNAQASHDHHQSREPEVSGSVPIVRNC